VAGSLGPTLQGGAVHIAPHPRSSGGLSPRVSLRTADLKGIPKQPVPCAMSMVRSQLHLSTHVHVRSQLHLSTHVHVRSQLHLSTHVHVMSRLHWSTWKGGELTSSHPFASLDWPLQWSEMQRSRTCRSHGTRSLGPQVSGVPKQQVRTL
jgi:hypothetical protein